MSYTVKYYKGQYSAISEIEIGICDACETRQVKIQMLPAELNAGEYYCASLCRICLLRLAKELI